MSAYTIGFISKYDKRANEDIDILLSKEGIERDGNLDYTIGIYNESGVLIGTGSCFMSSLRCLAVDSDYQGEGILNIIVTHLLEYQMSKGIHHVFLYTKCEKARFFASLGFHEIARVEGKVVFMENKRNGFASYLDALKKTADSSLKSAALIINANPFTKGHRYLVEKASFENELVHLFIVSEDISLIPFSIRRRLILEGTSHLKNIVYHNTGDYLISSATFPSYFLKDSDTVSYSHACLDVEIFCKIANALSVTRRYVGEEKLSHVTFIYNEVMSQKLSKNGIELITVPRITEDGQPISASTVRKALQNDDFALLKKLLPLSSYSFFTSEESLDIISKIKAQADVVHH